MSMSNQSVFVVHYPPQYGIVTSELTPNNFFSETLFPDVYSGCHKSVESIIKRNLECNQDENKVSEPFINPIIAITGTRGSGKSSAMISFAEYLKKATINGATFSVLSSIDATQFGKNESVIGNITASMYREYGYISDKLSVDKKREFVRLAKEVNNTAVMYSTGDWFRCGDDLLQDSEMIGNLRKRLHDLIMVYLQLRFDSYSNNHYLVIMLDDLDMCNEGAFSIIEEIRKFLCMRNVIILMTMKSDQLRTVLQASYSKIFKDADNEIKLELQSISRDLAFRSFEKLFPAARCHAMPMFNVEQLRKIDLLIEGVDKHDIYGRDIKKPTDPLFKKLKNSEEKNERTKIFYRTLHLIWRKTLMIPMCNKDGEYLLIPNNLRSLHNFIAMLSAMEDVIQVDKINEREFPTLIPGVGFNKFTTEDSNYINKQALKNNLSIFEKYLLDNLSVYGDSLTYSNENQKLIKTLLNLIFEMDTVSLEQLNAKIVGDILESQLPLYIENAFGTEIDVLKNAIYYNGGISVGDVIYVLGKISNKTRCRYISYIIEVIQTLWSIRMTKEFYLYCNYNSTKLEISSSFRAAIGGLMIDANATTFTECQTDGDWYQYQEESYIGKKCYVASFKILNGDLRNNCKDYRVPNLNGEPYYEGNVHGSNDVCHPLAYYTNELNKGVKQVLHFPFYSLDYLNCFYNKFRELCRKVDKNIFENKGFDEVFNQMDIIKDNATINLINTLQFYIPIVEYKPHSANVEIYNSIARNINIKLKKDYPGKIIIEEILNTCRFLESWNTTIEGVKRGDLVEFIEILNSLKTIEEKLIKFDKDDSDIKNNGDEDTAKLNDKEKNDMVKNRDNEYKRLVQTGFYKFIEELNSEEDSNI